MNNTVRNAINSVIIEFNLKKGEICEVDKYQWKIILDKFETKFINKSHYTQKTEWYWEHFKSDYAIQFEDNSAYEYLSNLIEENEKVWFFVEEVSQVPKFWIYEGTVNAIQMIIGETVGIGEYYIVSKKFNWVLCENHHRYLIASGDHMIDKLKRMNLLN